MKKIITSILLALTCITSLTQAQDNKEQNNTTTNKLHFWEASLPGGDYLVALNRITSISMHSYLLEGYIIYEVVVDTSGNALARFYAIELAGEASQANIAKNLVDRGKSTLEAGGKRTGIDPNTLVEKKRHNTHAKTIEYRVFDKNDLDQLFQSATKAWRSGRGRKFTIR